jgi:hypothetical protein
VLAIGTDARPDATALNEGTGGEAACTPATCAWLVTGGHEVVEPCDACPGGDDSSNAGASQATGGASDPVRRLAVEIGRAALPTPLDPIP